MNLVTAIPLRPLAAAVPRSPKYLASAYKQDSGTLRVEAELRPRLFRREVARQQSLAYRVASHDNFVGREEPLHAGVCHAYAPRVACEHLVGNAGV